MSFMSKETTTTTAAAFFGINRRIGKIAAIANIYLLVDRWTLESKVHKISQLLTWSVQPW